MISIGKIISDQMTESIFLDEKSSFQLFSSPKQKKIEYIDFLSNGKKAIEDYSGENGLALSEEEILYLSDYYTNLKSNPTDAELMMFSQANSEHCRHKIFNASWTIEGKTQENSLFGMIRNTHKASPQKTIVAYSDNSSVIEGSKFNRFYPNKSGLFQENLKLTHYLMKVETHNHPTAISPFVRLRRFLFSASQSLRFDSLQCLSFASPRLQNRTTNHLERHRRLPWARSRPPQVHPRRRPCLLCRPSC